MGGYKDLIDISPKGLIHLSKMTPDLRYLTLYKSNRYVPDDLEESFLHWKELVGICFRIWEITQTTQRTTRS